MCSKRKHKYLNIQYKLWAKNSILFEKEYVLMRNGKDLVGTEDYRNGLESTRHKVYI